MLDGFKTLDQAKKTVDTRNSSFYKLRTNNADKDLNLHTEELSDLKIVNPKFGQTLQNSISDYIHNKPKGQNQWLPNDFGVGISMGNYGNLESMNLTQNPLRQNSQGHASVKNHKTLKFEDSQNRFKNFRKSVNPDPVYQNIEPRNKLQSHIAEMNQQISLQRPMTFHEKHKALSKLQN